MNIKRFSQSFSKGPLHFLSLPAGHPHLAEGRSGPGFVPDPSSTVFHHPFYPNFSFPPLKEGIETR